MSLYTILLLHIVSCSVLLFNIEVLHNHPMFRNAPGYIVSSPPSPGNVSSILLYQEVSIPTIIGAGRPTIH